MIFQYVKPGRIRLSADRGFPDDDLFALLDELGIDHIIRVKGSVKVFYRERWGKFNTIRFEGNARRRSLGRLYYCEKSPRRLWITMSRARNKKGKLETWHLVSNLKLRAEPLAKEYGFRFCWEEGFRDAKWYLGFAEARFKEIEAWSRLFALFATALLALTTLGMALLIRGSQEAKQLLRRVASRQKCRCELSLIAAAIALVQQDRTLFLEPEHTIFSILTILSLRLCFSSFTRKIESRNRRSATADKPICGGCRSPLQLLKHFKAIGKNNSPWFNILTYFT